MIRKTEKRRNPIAWLMQTTDGRRIFGQRTERAKKGRGSYRRKNKHRGL